MKKSDYKTRLFHTLAISGLLLGSIGATAAITLIPTNNVIRTHASATPVADDTSARSITIHKYDGGPSTTAATGTTADAANVGSRNPLANISFTVQKVKPTDGAKNMKADDATTYTTDGDSTVVTTDDTGTAKANLGTGTAADGYYLVTEQASASVKAVAAPFIVRVPLTQTGANTADASLVYDVNVYPKNETNTIALHPVKTFANSSPAESIKLGADVSWDLTIATPSDIYTAATDTSPEVSAQSLVFSDPIDTTSLTFKQVDSVKLVGGPNDGTALVADTDYKVDSTGSKTVNGTVYQVVQISLTKDGMKKAAGSTSIVSQLTTGTKANSKDPSDARIVNTFDTYYVQGTGIKTHETTISSGNVTPGDNTDPNKPDVPTDPNTDPTNPTIKFGNVDVLKTDDTSAAKPLADATFHLAASEADAKAGNWVKGADGNALVVTTNADGKGEFTGLQVDPDSGTKDYYLVETDAPAGYDIDGTIYKVTANNDTTVDATVKDADNMLPNLPMTGSDARLLLLVTATVLIVGSGSALYIKRRRNQSQD